MAGFFWFSDEQWARIEPLLPRDTRGMPRVDDRRVLSGIVHALKSGGRWGDCPEHVYGAEEDALQPVPALGGARRVGAHLRRSGRDRRPALEAVHRQQLHQGPPHGGRRKRGALANGIGTTKGGRNTKLHAVCNEEGRPHVLLLTPGNTHDCKVAMLAIGAVPPSAYLVADTGYDSNALRAWLVERGTTPVIPARSNRKAPIGHDRHIYRQRNVIERMFCRFKDWRRVATRFDRNIKTFLATLAIAAFVTWWL